MGLIRGSHGAWFVAGLLAVAAAPARAQIGASVGIDSDYRYRGVSLSDGAAELRTSIAWDHASGAYAGASLLAVDPEDPARRAAVIAYLGYARRGAPGLGWEAGLTGMHFGGDGNSRYDGAELYAGLIAERWNARLYYTPSYFGSGATTLYAEWNGATTLAGATRLFGHLGALANLRGTAWEPSRTVRADTRLGIAAAQGGFELQLAWVAGRRSPLYPVSYGDKARAWVLSASYFF